MYESLLLWSFLLPGQTPQSREIPVQSVVVSLIDDVELSFEEAGLVKEVFVQPGDEVQRGDLLAELDRTDALLELRRIEADLEMAHLKARNDLSVQLSHKALSVARSELSRARKANEKFAETVSESEIDRLELRVDEAELQVQQAKLDVEYQRLQVQLKDAERDIVQRKIERRQLRSPLDGMIVECNLQAGELTHPEQSFCRILNVDRIRVEGYVQAAENSVEIGDLALVQWKNPQDDKIIEFPGKITFVDPEIDSITNQYKVWAEVENTMRVLRPGYRPSMVILSKN